jgi:hypothetical protein
MSIVTWLESELRLWQGSKCFSAVTMQALEREANNLNTVLARSGLLEKRLDKEQVHMLLATLSHEQQEHYARPEFLQNCHRLFKTLDKNGSGYLEDTELRNCVVMMLPAMQQKDIKVKNHKIICPTEASITSIVSAFDEDGDGRINEVEFPEFVKFCQAWRLHVYFHTPAVPDPGKNRNLTRSRPGTSLGVRSVPAHDSVIDSAVQHCKASSSARPQTAPGSSKKQNFGNNDTNMEQLVLEDYGDNSDVESNAGHDGRCH